MALVTKPTGTLKIKDSASSKVFSIAGINATLNSETVAAAEVNKLFYVAGLSTVGDSNTRLIIEKGVANNG